MGWMRLCVVAGILAGGAAGTAAQEGTMSADALAAYVSGKSYTGVVPETGATVASVIYALDGTSTLTLADGTEEPGTWRLEDDAYCTRYATFRDDTENCFRLVPLEDGRAQAYYTDGRPALILVPNP